jgi:hypothetical protein
MRRIVFECPLDAFRTSPLVFMRDGYPLGVDAASMQMTEHTLSRHGGADAIRWVSIDMPEETPREEPVS